MDKKGKILIVDDEVDLLETMRFRLETSGYDMAVTPDPKEAMQKAKEHKPGLILLDIMMPKIDGFTLLKDFKADSETKNIPVIIVSCGKEEEELAKRSLALGASGYVVKPFDTASLLFMIDKFLQKGETSGV